MTSQSLPALVDMLVALTPGTGPAEAPQHAIESLLMGALRTGGRVAGEALIESLAAHGYALGRVDARPWMWRIVIPPPRVLEIWFNGLDEPVVAAVSYREGKPWGSKAQRSAANRHAAFYERYTHLDAQGGVLLPDDRMILLVGELEADVNNGGFGQYLGNKGEARAREALVCLTAIGAKRTGRWLAAALENSADTDRLGQLDQQFNDKPEDLAALAMIYIGRRTKA